MRVALAGGDIFTVPTLQALALTDSLTLTWVAATPDRAAGRGMRVQLGPVPAACAQLNIPCQQPASSTELASLFAQQPVDFFITCAYGRKLSEQVLTAPARACVNIHASLLPRWRGAAPIERAILAGDSITGITTMLMSERIDTGAILQQAQLSIKDTATGGSLRYELAKLGARLIIKTLTQFDAITPTAQNNHVATAAPRLRKEEAALDWSATASQVERQVRAFNPAPGAYTHVGSERIKILVARSCSGDGAQGTLLACTDEGLVIACGSDALLVTKVQPAGKKTMSTVAWLRGKREQIMLGMLVTIAPAN